MGLVCRQIRNRGGHTWNWPQGFRSWINLLFSSLTHPALLRPPVLWSAASAPDSPSARYDSKDFGVRQGVDPAPSVIGSRLTDQFDQFRQRGQQLPDKLGAFVAGHSGYPGPWRASRPRRRSICNCGTGPLIAQQGFIQARRGSGLRRAIERPCAPDPHGTVVAARGEGRAVG